MYFQDGERDAIAMVAEKQAINRTANYHVFDMSRNIPGRSPKLNKKAGNYMGKLRGAHGETEYSLFNNATTKEQCAAFVFQKVGILTQIKGQIPRKLVVLLPPITEEGATIPFQTNQDSDMIERFDNNIKGKMRVLNTKEPTFERGQYRLNFSGRVTTPSVKNFQIVDPSDTKSILAQFGRGE
jgi:hypothetical protein